MSCVCTGEDEDQFEQFMLPLTGAFEAIAQMFSTNTFNEQEAKVSSCTHKACEGIAWLITPLLIWLRLEVLQGTTQKSHKCYIHAGRKIFFDTDRNILSTEQSLCHTNGM